MATTPYYPCPPEIMAELMALGAALNTAPHGQRRAMVEGFAARLGKNPNTVYGWLKVYTAFDSGRKRRADAGRTRVPEETLELIAAMQREGVRANGKRTMPLAVAIDVAATNGIDVAVSESQVARLLRNKRMDTKSVMSARNHIQLRSLYPNHVHQIDPSLCVLYYMGSGANRRQYIMTEDKFYKNKLENYAKVVLKVWRNSRIDHASGVVDVRYFESAGESQAMLFEFLLWTWGKQEGRLNHGVPKMLLWDKGSANTSHSIQNLLNALGVDHQTHAPGHAWAKGGVEQANNLIETQFESRLKLEPVNSVDELNAAALRWSRDWNANTFARIDSRITRASGERLVRDDLWSLILRTPGALVEMPSREVCAWFLSGKEQSRQVRDLRITFVHPELGRSAAYELRAWAEHLHNGQKVNVTPLLLRDGLLRVEIPRAGGESIFAEVEPQRAFDAFGRSESAQVIGEGYSRAPETAAEGVARRLAIAAYGEGATADSAETSRSDNQRPFAHLNDGAGLVAHSHLGQAEQQSRLLPTAAEVGTDAVRTVTRRVQEVEAAPLDQVEAAMRLRAMVGELWTKEQFAWLGQRYPNGVPEDALEEIAAQIRNPGAVPKTALRAV